MIRHVLLVILFTLSSLHLHGQDSLIVKSIYFGGGSHYIDDIQLAELKIFIEDIEHLENYEIIIFGHTDNIGSQAYNQWLSKMRSQNVYNSLLQMNVPEELMEIKSFGYKNPLYSNTSHAGRVMNRRVDVILSPLVF